MKLVISVAKIFLLNDVECESDVGGLLHGQYKTHLTDLGVKQCVETATYLSSIVKSFDFVVSSDSSRVTKLLHQIRLKCKIRHPKISYCPSLRERNFGVLNGTRFINGFSSDLFRHSRICSENGESVAQCVERCMKIIRPILVGKDNVLCVSHPFLCQIICNSINNKKQTTLTSFWTQKTSLLIAEHKNGVLFKSSYHNCMEKKLKSEDEVYGQLL